MNEDLIHRWQEVEARVAAACARADRAREEVCLVAVSKFQPGEAIRALHAQGQGCFGESRVQELEAKIVEHADLGLDWHFIGRLQKNKVRKVLGLTPWLHGIDSLKLASRIGRIAGEEGIEARGFLQVMLVDEDSKAGFLPDELRVGFAELAAIEHLRIEGLMCLPPVDSAEAQRPRFAALRQLRDELEATHKLALPHLSMGMSNDFDVAIEEGATHIRPGTALFGARPIP